MDVKEWAKLQESLLKSQLATIREFLRWGEEPIFKPHKKGRSQMSIIYDILLSSPKPLHIAEIITRAKEDFGVNLDRESIVSAITKKVKSGRIFTRVGPNTFAILDSPSGAKTNITNPQ
jgi:predicted transcriptional regulator